MPKMIQRWDLYDHTWHMEGCPLPPGGATMVERQKGEYVTHADHVAEVERLEAENKALRETLKRMQKPVGDKEATQFHATDLSALAFANWVIAARAAEPKEEPKP